MKLRLLQEEGIIEAVRKDFFSKKENILFGIGDDAAVIREGGKNLVLTKDLLIENVHFRSSFSPPRFLGRKSLAVNLSDIAAMGAEPRFALLGLGLPKKTPPDFVESFFEGFKSAAEYSGTVLVGGDISRSERIVISVTVIGEGKKIIGRSGCRPGDLLYVSGTLGDAAEGLTLLKKGIRWGDEEEKNILLKAFLDPAPCLSLGRKLARSSCVSSMIDLSDGLSADLEHLCRESGCGAEVEKTKIPLSPLLKKISRRPYGRAFHGGEDYELLFTVPPGKEVDVKRISRDFPLSRIGRMIKGKGIYVIEKNGGRKPLEKKVFKHF